MAGILNPDVMKKIFPLFLIAIIFSSAHGQSLGLKASPNITVTGTNPQAGLGFSGGIYYDQHIYKRLGLSTGIMFTQFRVAKSFGCYLCLDCCPDRIEDRFDILEIPLDLTMDLSMHPDSKWRFLLTGGYSFGEIIGKQNIVYDNEEKSSSEITNLHGLISQLHFFKIGFEVRRNVLEKMNLSFGAQYKATGIYDEVYGEFSNWEFFMKTGFDLKYGN